MNIHLQNKMTGEVEETPIGFSVTCLFFGGLVPIIRGDWGGFLKLALFGLLTCGIYHFVFAATYNHSYIKKLIMKGYEPASEQAETYLKMNGLYSSPSQPQQQFAQSQPQGGSITTAPIESLQGASSSVEPTENNLVGNQFILARHRAIGMKNDYDVISVESGLVALCLKEEDIGLSGSAVRIYAGEGWSKFKLNVTKPNGDFVCAISGGGVGGEVELFGVDGHKMGGLKKSGVTKTKLEAFDSSGVVFNTVSDGVGKLTKSHTITRSGSQIGKINYINNKRAEQLLGERLRMLNSKYDYNAVIDLHGDFSELHKIMVIAANYTANHILEKW